jgi:HK97 gp10 family phage protein
MPNNQVTIKFNGLTQALAQIDQWNEEKLQAVRDAVNESALNIQREAKKRCPADYGRLRASIQIEPATGHSIGLRVGTNVEYAPYVEWGTGIYAEHPDIPGRQTPWAFPVAATSGKKNYNWKIIEIDGEPYYVTKGAKPHPYLYPSAEEEKPNFLANVKEALKK